MQFVFTGGRSQNAAIRQIFCFTIALCNASYFALRIECPDKGREPKREFSSDTGKRQMGSGYWNKQLQGPEDKLEVSSQRRPGFC